VTRRDPRLPFAAILTLYAVAGVAWLGFNRNPVQLGITVASACLLDMALHFLLRKRELLVPLSAYITGLSLALILNYSHDYVLLAFPVFMAIGSKYLFTVNGAHRFNPSLFGVVASLVLAGNLISTAPAYQWGGTWQVSAFMVMAALSLFIFKIDRGWLVGSFLLFYTLQTAVRAYLMRDWLPPEMLFLGTLSTPPFFLFTFFMITDPKTSPASRRGQIGVALAIALLDFGLNLVQSVFTFFYAAFIVQAARFAWAHWREMQATGVRTRVRLALANRHFLRTAGVLVILATAGDSLYLGVLRPQVFVQDVGFTLHQIPAAQSRISVAMDLATLDLVDPRLRNVAKWLMSVGSSVAVADVNGDGLPDLFLVNPLARAPDRYQLLLNQGDFHFTRVPVPALERIANDPRTYGFITGAVFFDSENDGDQDLLLPVSFGKTILLRNRFRETGRVEFEDVSHQAGVDEYTISVAANVIDYDRDGFPDILLANVMNPLLPGYDRPTRLNILDLPQPQYSGDRRMFRFMPNSWSNATNGGGYLLFHNDGHGHFQKMEAAALGLGDTRWSLSIGTGDLNDDGWTDLYVANDFGPDDLYINTHGRFVRVAGPLFGDVGKDTYKGMDSTLADFARTGRLDVYVSDVHHALQAEGSLLWMNQGNDGRGFPRLQDEATARGVLNEDRFGWGAAAGDLSNGGWLDLVQANGMVDDRLDHRFRECPDYWYANQKILQSGPEIHMYADQWGDLRGRCIFPNELRRVYYNRGADARPQFIDVADLVGLTQGDNSRGVALADLTNDGRLDAIITNQFGPPTILENRPTHAPNSWVGLTLEGDGATCNSDAIGSTVTLQLPGQPVQLAEVQAVNGFSAAGDRRVHFGLGPWSGGLVDVTVRWCGQQVSQYQLTPGAYHLLHFGEG